MFKRIVMLTLAAIAGGSVMGSPAAGKKKPAKAATSGFWADSRDDFYHQSRCTTSHKPAGAQLVTGSEQELIDLAYYPDPRCLPGRVAAIRAGRIVRVEGGELVAPPTVTTEGSPFPGAEPPSTGGFPGLAPGAETKPAAPKPPEAKPAEPKPSPAAKAEPKPPATGGFPSPGGAPPTPPAAPVANRPDPAFFRAHVQPVLKSCSSKCHGQSGHMANRRFPMQGNERDYNEALRRIVFRDPASSLLVLKPTARVRHGGGQQLSNDSVGLKALVDWINGVVAQ